MTSWHRFWRGTAKSSRSTPPRHGGSELLALMTMERCAAATLEVLDALGIDRFVWVGTSWGGLVGIEAARQAPARFDKLICLNTPVTFGGPTLSTRFITAMAGLAGPSKFFADQVAKTFFMPATRTAVGH